MNDGGQPLEHGTITFIQNHLPPLQAGEYVVTVEHQIQLTLRDGCGQVSGAVDERYGNTHRFAVQGERFVLNPSEIDSVFPPPNNQGEYVSAMPVNRTAPAPGARRRRG